MKDRFERNPVVYGTDRKAIYLSPKGKRGDAAKAVKPAQPPTVETYSITFFMIRCVKSTQLAVKQRGIRSDTGLLRAF